MRGFTRISFVAAIFVSACAQPVPNGGGPADSASPPVGGGSTGEQADWSAILRLEDQAKAIAKSSGCARVSECRTAPVGNRACGGPRYYIAYCSTTTDSVALFRKLGEVAEAENAYNRKYGIASTCEFRMPGPVTLVGGECRAAGQ